MLPNEFFLNGKFSELFYILGLQIRSSPQAGQVSGLLEQDLRHDGSAGLSFLFLLLELFLELICHKDPYGIYGGNLKGS